MTMINFIKRLIRRNGTTLPDLSWQDQVQDLLAAQQGQIADLSKRIDVVRRQVYRTAEKEAIQGNGEQAVDPAAIFASLKPGDPFPRELRPGG